MYAIALDMRHFVMILTGQLCYNSKCGSCLHLKWRKTPTHHPFCIADLQHDDSMILFQCESQVC